MRSYQCQKCEGTNVTVQFSYGSGFQDPGRLECYCTRCRFRWLEPTSDDRRDRDERRTPLKWLLGLWAGAEGSPADNPSGDVK